MRHVKFVVVLAAAAAACQLHDIADALENGRAAAAPHEWPYAAACAAFANTTDVVARLLFFALIWRAARRPAPRPLDDRPSQRLYNIGKAFVELKRRELGNRRRRGDDPDEDDGRSPDSVLFGAPRFGARLPARFGDGRSVEREELLSIDGSAPTSPV